MKIIGLDVGSRRIGVAKADSGTRIAVPVGYILADGSEWQEIARIANLQGTNWFVLGLPRSNNGNETKQSLYVRNFAKLLIEKIPGAKVRFQDESLTSVEAEERLKKRKKTYEKGEIDAEAACIILQDFLEGFNRGDSMPEGMQDRAHLGANAKKETEKIKLNNKRVKSKMKKWPLIIILLVVLAAGATGVGLFLKREADRRAYAEYVAEKEAEVAEVFNFTIRPGETIYDIKEALIQEGYTPAEVEAGLNAEYDYDFLKKRPEGANLEGYLYGETYEFYETATVEDILDKFLSGMEKVITENNLEANFKKQGLTLHEGVTLASVVQKESPAGEQATIAQVFLSRLAAGWKLGSDVTVSYALDVIDPYRTTYSDNAAALTVDSCYNTRLYTGLPCGPIANPNLASLLAVAEPAETEYMFFLTGDDGLMYYSYTEAEHNQKAAEHCQTLCNISL